MSACNMVYQWKPKPGRTADFFGLYREFAPQFKEAGASDNRLFQTNFGSASVGEPVYAWVVEFESQAQYGTFMDAMNTAPDDLAGMIDKIFGPDAPAEAVGSVLVQEVNL